MSGELNPLAAHPALSLPLVEVSEAGVPRFKPPLGLPDEALAGLWEPGQVSVEFALDLPLVNLLPKIIPTHTLINLANVTAVILGQLLQHYNLQRVERTFRTLFDAVVTPDLVFNHAHFLTLHFPGDVDVERVARELAQLPLIRHAMPVPQVIPPGTPNDEPGIPGQWYFERCGVPAAWSLASGKDTVIADVDWGYRVTHEDLSGRVKETFNSFDGGTNVSHGTRVKHGTAVLGLAGAADNNRGIAGIAFDADLWAIQANSGPGPRADGDPWANAIKWAYQKNSGGKKKVLLVEVQTSRRGNIEMYRPVWQAIKDAIAAGVVVCVAAGNGDIDAGLDHQSHSIDPTGSILVGATAKGATSNPRASFSNWGERITVSAPGDPDDDLTCSSAADDKYLVGFGGTSGAAPKVAGTIALMLEVNPNLKHDEIKAILTETGTRFTNAEADKPIGVFLNAEAAVKEAKRRA